MKKLTLAITAIALMVSVESFAQAEKKAQYLSLGPVGGIGMSWVNNASTDVKLSGQMGVALLYSRFEHWGWGGSLNVTREGYRDRYAMYGVMYNESFTPTYLRFTPRAYYFFGAYKDAVRPKVFAGPSVAVKLGEDHYVHTEAPMGDVTLVPTYADVYRAADFGAEAGAGLNVRLTKGVWLNLDGTYYHGLTNATYNDSKNRNLMMNAGVLIGL